MEAPPFPAAAIAAARDAVKAHLRIEGAHEDAAIERVVATALALGEAFTGTAWIARDWQAAMPATRGWQLLATAPVTAITQVEGLPAGGPASALPADGYAIDIDANGQGWVRVTAAEAMGGRVRVTFAAGAAAGWGDLPPPIAQGAVLLAAHCLEARIEGAAPPAVVAALWRPWRRMRLGEALRPA